MFLIFKGVKSRELEWEVNHLADKWELDKEILKDRPSLKIVPIARVQQLASAMTMVEAFVSDFGKRNSRSPGVGIQDLNSTVTEMLKQEGWSPNYWKVGWDNPKVCLRKAIMPF